MSEPAGRIHALVREKYGALARIDAFVARRLVGEEGYVHGVAMTPDMVAKAQAECCQARVP